MARRTPISAIILLAVLAFFSITYLFSSSGSGSSTSFGSGAAKAAAPLVKDSSADTVDLGAVDSGILLGESIAPKLENATLKAELGRASWKLFHTMMARFPEKPTADESLALKTYIQLFARLYPCGDCARHFRGLLAKYPPQVSSRQAAAGWACFVHNEVNTRLEKEQFDCNNIGDFYDCGCGEEGKDGKDGKEGEKKDDGSVELRGDS
ncbi:FAD-linked sulfhydryl oxidase ERV2 [Plectosphaerella cucumerina]|uniref:Sulfhydryl oxidase n=1 Tax=Plectosphaerella cucumerina TaxID=40658 RepID=A0A8K0TN94_9PEZI|nr:FAD-linked sulfhydryl oxidase ERV2 [Plectosphaerella cucumerina]